MTPPEQLPDPGQARSLGDLIDRLRALKAWTGNPSYETIKNRVNHTWHEQGRPAGELTKKATVADCFKPGRRRVNTELVIAVVRALHPDAGYVAQWRQALRVVAGETAAAAQVRAQDTLPEPLAEFTGRDAELARLRQRSVRGGTVVISAIEGMAGVGKTQLAIHAGHLLVREGSFEQTLFVNLRGFHPDPAQPPADPAAVLDSFLRLLGVPGARIPHDLPARAALYRQRLAGRRSLVVLDNAADEHQVEPLLPGSPGSLTMITSRRDLGGLGTAAHLHLDVFTPAEAVGFLARTAPDVSAGDESAALVRVAERCGHLPLALGLVTAHMRTRSGWTATDHADWLDERSQDHRLATEVELALGLSYQDLPAPQQRLFRLLALHQGNDIDPYAAAALAGTGLDTAREHLRRLTADHLLRETAPGRFAFHDLVRAYAYDRTKSEDRPPDRWAALTRLFHHYLHTAASAMDTLDPVELRRRPRVSPPATPMPPVADETSARAWLDTERANLVASAVHAARHGHPDHTMQMAATLYRYLDTGGHHGEAITLHNHAQQVAHDAGDLAGEAHTLTNLGVAHFRQGRLQLAINQQQRSIALARRIGDSVGEARALTNLGGAYWQMGRRQNALRRHEQALARLREADERLDEAKVLGNLGLVHQLMGDHQQALGHHRQALVLFRELDYRLGEARTLGNLGEVYCELAQYPLAIDHHRQALAGLRELGERSGEAIALNDLGFAYQRMEQWRAAADHYRQALGRFRELGEPDGEINARIGIADTLIAGGRPEQAQEHLLVALELATDIGDQHRQARAHDGLAEVHHRAGAADQAQHHWRQALALYTDLGASEADDVRSKLTRLS